VNSRVPMVMARSEFLAGRHPFQGALRVFVGADYCTARRPASSPQGRAGTAITLRPY
jgi:hypothetical protein